MDLWRNSSTHLYVIWFVVFISRTLIIEANSLLSSRVRWNVVQDLYVYPLVSVSVLAVVLGNYIRILLIETLDASVGFVLVLSVKGALIERSRGALVVAFPRRLGSTKSQAYYQDYKWNENQGCDDSYQRRCKWGEVERVSGCRRWKNIFPKELQLNAILLLFKQHTVTVYMVKKAGE